MPRFKEHAVIGTTVGALFSLVTQSSRQAGEPYSIDPMHVSACALAGFLGGCVPDVVEPANRMVGPNHRGAFHSFWLLALMMKGAHHFATLNAENEADRWLADIAGAACAGVSSHLIADSTTSRGLNLICKEF